MKANTPRYEVAEDVGYGETEPYAVHKALKAALKTLKDARVELANVKAAVKAAANVKAEGPSRKGVKIYFALPV